jgi:hypothetical protein
MKKLILQLGTNLEFIIFLGSNCNLVHLEDQIKIVINSLLY